MEEVLGTSFLALKILMKYQIEKQVENEVQARLMKERVEREKKLQREVRWEFLFCLS